MGAERLSMAEARAAWDAWVADLEARVGSLRDAQLDAHPASGGWSVREVLGHLTLAVRLYDGCLRGLLAQQPAVRAAAAQPAKPGWFARMLLRSLPNLDRTFRAPRLFDPRRTDERFDVPAVLDAHRSFGRAAADVEARGLGEVRIGTPLSRLLRVRAREAVEIQVLHGRRHLQQIDRLLA